MSQATNRNFFSKVAIARQLLREKSEQILEEYLDVVQKAKDAGDFETAAKQLQWLMEHMPADETGERIVDKSVDKKVEQIQQGPVGPAIQIGIAVGGLGQRSLPNPEKPAEVKVIEGEEV